MPIYYWDRLLKTGDLSNLETEGGAVTTDLKEYFHKLNDEYIALIGLSASFKESFNTKIKVIDLVCEYIKTGNRFLLNEIEMLNDEIELLEGGVKSISLDKSLSLLEERFHFAINAKEVSVTDYYRRVKHLSND